MSNIKMWMLDSSDKKTELTNVIKKVSSTVRIDYAENGTFPDFQQYDMLLVHNKDAVDKFSNIMNDCSEGENLSYLFILYSDGWSNYEEKALNNGFRSIKLSANYLRENLGHFLKKFIEAKATNTIQDLQLAELCGFNPKLDSALELLQLFLPLDIQLQLGDSDKCKNTATSFDTGKANAHGLLNKVGVNDSKNFDSLLLQIEQIKSSGHTNPLFQNFHQTYINLRDELLLAVGNK